MTDRWWIAIVVHDSWKLVGQWFAEDSARTTVRELCEHGIYARALEASEEEPVAVFMSRVESEPIHEATDIVKDCGCGERYTRAAWYRLRFIGYQSDSPRLELRNCSRCGSTRAIPA